MHEVLPAAHPREVNIPLHTIFVVFKVIFTNVPKATEATTSYALKLEMAGAEASLVWNQFCLSILPEPESICRKDCCECPCGLK